MEEKRMLINHIMVNGRQAEVQRKDNVGFYFVFVQDTNLDMFKNKCRACDTEFYTMFKIINSCPICGRYDNDDIEK